MWEKEKWSEFFSSPDFIFWAVTGLLGAVGVFGIIKVWLAGLFIQDELQVLVSHGVERAVLINAIVKVVAMVLAVEVVAAIIYLAYRYFYKENESPNKNLKTLSVKSEFLQAHDNTYTYNAYVRFVALKDGVYSYFSTQNWTGDQGFSFRACEIKSDGSKVKIGFTKLFPA